MRATEPRAAELAPEGQREYADGHAQDWRPNRRSSCRRSGARRRPRDTRPPPGPARREADHSSERSIGSQARRSSRESLRHVCYLTRPRFTTEFVTAPAELKPRFDRIGWDWSKKSPCWA